MHWWKRSSPRAESRSGKHQSQSQQQAYSQDALRARSQIPTILEAWLNIREVRSQRRFLEANPDLLVPECEAALSQLIDKYSGQQTHVEFLTDARFLIQDAQARGATRDAIRDAYVNVYGGLALDAPPWLEEIERKVEFLRSTGNAQVTLDARLDLLQGALSRIQKDDSLPPELAAGIMQNLQASLREVVDQRLPLAVDERVSLLQASLQVYVPSRYPRMYASMLTNLGGTYYDRILGNRSDNLEQAIFCYREALPIFTETSFPIQYSHIMNNLGNALVARSVGNPQDNLEEAIRCFHAAINIRTREAFPAFYAQSMSNLGNAFLARVAGDREHNIEEAIICYREALQINMPTTSATEFANTIMNLGSAYFKRIAGQRRENLDESIQCYRQALRIHTRTTSPYRYAQIMQNLASVYSEYGDISQGDHIEKAIACYRETLDICTRNTFPHDYATAMEDLGRAYFIRGRRRRRDDIEKAIACYREALQIHSQDAFPFEYAHLMDSLGTALSDPILGDVPAYIDEAIKCYRAALQVYTHRAAPLDHAKTMTNLGTTLLQRGSGSRSESIEEAIACQREALVVFSLETNPSAFALVINNLGNAYLERVSGLKGENIEEAIKCYHQALQVYRADLFPEEFARSKANIAVALVERQAGGRKENLEEALIAIRECLSIVDRDKSTVEYARAQNVHGCILTARLLGEKRANLEQAIASFQEALRIYTLEAFPQTHAETLCNLGNALKSRIEGIQLQNLQAAIACFQQALQVRTRDTYPIEWASTQNFMGEVYDALIGVLSSDTSQAEAQKRAVECFAAALTVFTREDYPQLWAFTMRALGEVYASPTRDHIVEKIDNALTCISQALTIYTRESDPLEWAYTQHGLGQVYMNQRVIGSMGENVDRAIACYESALQVLTREANPQDWANLQYSLGLAYSQSIHSNVDERTERAIASYQAALQIFDRKAFPRQHSNLLRVLGQAYISRRLGNQAENIERGIVYCTDALHVLAREDNPFEWARTQESLGDAYKSRKHGIRDENLEIAIDHFTKAMEVYTREAFPFEWAKLRHHLGDVYLDQSRGHKGTNIERAIACYQDDLSVRTFETASVVWALTQRELGISYGVRIQGDRRENLQKSATCYANALRVFTPETFPTDHRATALDAAFTEMERANWSAADALLRSAQQSEGMLLKLATGIREQDVVLARGQDTATLHAYVLAKLGRPEEALVAVERGRAHTLAAARALDAADPSLIRDPNRRDRYIEAWEKLISAQRNANLATLDTLNEQGSQEFYLAQVDALRKVEAEFQAVVTEIRAAHDPDKFLVEDIDIATIWRAAKRGGPSHGLIYLLATPMGGAAIAALCGNEALGLPDRCEVLNIPALDRALVYTLTEGQMLQAPRRFVGGFALAQSGRSFDHVLATWQGTTLAAKATRLHEECKANGIQSTLDSALQTMLDNPAVQKLSTLPLDALTPEQRATLEATLDFAFLRLELQISLRGLSSSMHVLAQWLQRQQVYSTTLIPCGQLAAIPLLAVPMDQSDHEMTMPENWRTFNDNFPSSVAPSARSLLPAERGDGRRTGVYTLGNPQWRSQPLPWGEAEALTVAKLAKQVGMTTKAQIQDDATRAWLIDVLQAAEIADISCHGAFDPIDVLRSRLFLASGESLMLGNILGRETDLAGLRLLILSACQTANLDLHGATDEVHSLTTGMLQAGAKAVLGALWSVDDKATYLLMVRFAQEWFPNMAHESPAVALVRAQQWLRSVTNRELKEWRATELQQEQIPVQQSESDDELVIVRGRGSRYSVGDAQDIMRQAARRLADEDHPYNDPFYWAAFQLAGW